MNKTVLVAVLLIAGYVAGARYPAIASKFGLA